MLMLMLMPCLTNNPHHHHDGANDVNDVMVPMVSMVPMVCRNLPAGNALPELTLPVHTI